MLIYYMNSLKRYNIDHLNIYLRLKEATLRTEDADLIEIVDIFINKTLSRKQS